MRHGAPISLVSVVNVVILRRTSAETPLASDQIDRHTLEISQADDETYGVMQELADELPGHSPRFILLSYPLTLVGSAFRYQRSIVLRAYG